MYSCTQSVHRRKMRLQVIVVISIVLSAATINAENDSCFDAGQGYVVIRRHEIKNVLDVKSPEACQSQCQGNVECVVWTYDTHKRHNNDTFTHKPDCWLFKVKAPKESMQNFDDMTSGPPVCPNRDCFDVDVDTTGFDVGSGMDGVESAEHCQKICQVLEGCQYFTYVPAPTENADSWCYLKTHYNGTNTKTAVVSGPAYCPGDCYKYDVSYQSDNNITTKRNTSIQCQKACQNISECVAWTWKRSDDKKMENNICNLLMENGFRETSEVNATSGPKDCPASKENTDTSVTTKTSIPKDCYKKNKDYYHNDVHKGIGGVNSTLLCQMICKKMDDCFKWTWMNATEKYPTPYCYMKGKWNSVRDKINATAGPKYCSDPDPDPRTAVNETSGGCYYGDNIEYIGTVAESINCKIGEDGHKECNHCKNWNTAGLELNLTTYIFPERYIVDAKEYCRNLQGFEQPWCFTESNKPGKPEDCNVPICGGDCFDDNIIYNGNHIDEKVGYSAPACQKFCQEAPKCEVWNWVRGVGGRSDDLCHLLSKNYTVDKVSGHKTTSGPKYCPELVEEEECMPTKCDRNANCMTFGPGSSAKCLCDKGYTGDGINYCIKECSLSGHSCHHDASCVSSGDSAGSGECVCNTGYTGDGEQCEKVIQLNSTTTA